MSKKSKRKAFNDKRMLPTRGRAEQIKNKSNVARRRMERENDRSRAWSWAIRRGSIKTEEDGTMTAQGKPLTDYSHATLGEFLRLKGYEVPHSTTKENIIHGIRAWSEQRKPNAEETMLPRVTPKVEHTWESEREFTRNDEERSSLRSKVQSLEFKVCELEHTMKKIAKKETPREQSKSKETIVGMYNAGNDCWLIVAIRAIQMMYYEVFEKGDPESSYIFYLFKEPDYLTDVVQHMVRSIRMIGADVRNKYFTKKGLLNNRLLKVAIMQDNRSVFKDSGQWDGFEGFKYLHDQMEQYTKDLEHRKILPPIDEDVLSRLFLYKGVECSHFRTKILLENLSSRCRDNKTVLGMKYHCKHCSHKWDELEVWDELLLPNPRNEGTGRVGLEVLLRNKFSGLRHQQNLPCKKCKDDTGINMREVIAVTPKNLVIQIGRSGLDLGKDNTPVDPPLEGLYFGGDIYDLSMTMHHETYEETDTELSGHYFAYRRFQEEWVLCDDAALTTVPDGTITEKLRSDGKTISALFYYRRE